MAFVKLISATISSELLPSKGTEGQSECGFECEGGKYPQTQTHSPEAHRLSLCFVGCEGAKYPHTQTQTHAPEAHRLSL